MAAAYLHIPFCEHICFYCDFNKVFLEGQPVDEYVDALIKEMQLSKRLHPKEEISTFYIGGGTPTTLNERQLEKLLNGIRSTYALPKGAEFTMEANPESVSFEKLKIMRDYGVNRLSMGVQSFNNDILKKIGRIHTAEQVYTSVADARRAGFENMTIDLIFRLPNQTMADFEESLNKALELDLPHYSIYALILENKTVFYNLMRQGKLPLPSEDTEADMYALAIETMSKNGRNQYEISNFALPGYESQHNLTYWKNESYFGFGAGAHGYIDGIRYHNHGPIQQYLAPLRENSLPIIRQQQLSKNEQMEEEMILGLRTMVGVSQQHFADKFQISLLDQYAAVISDLVAEGLLVIDGDRIRLSPRGVFLGNEVFRSFLM
ncbi:radical SAM family heme chaperone HemW [Trichococcus pasteurii]|uniref:Heme chaperone HemW n=1 Tax=Trichococcus pasteurii TaxID=43064 RepID=A0A1W1ICC2_9LACT|nr:radical SAM family heme chaperone HemW [Trichococcus pasteurii]SFE30217.1 oxygen-independent coproporphyrinogen-3 oxidase [Trichococcus pasteurii]SLM50635.1 radical sam [Trichococcus pasteurii]SSB91516.1 radical sam [Trichococcus pasteurii]